MQTVIEEQRRIEEFRQAATLALSGTVIFILFLGYLDYIIMVQNELTIDDQQFLMHVTRKISDNAIIFLVYIDAS